MSYYKNRRALITGASSGLGEAFAETLAARGCHVTLVARSEDKLQALAHTLAQKHHVQTQAIAQDLSLPGAVARVFEQAQTGGQAVDILINNAGFGSCGRFDEQPVQVQLQQVQLNVAALLEMTHAFLPGMRQRRFGGILNVASTAAFQPLPYMATYAATKSFVLSLSEALWAETKEFGIHVSALCPGPVETNFFATMGSDLPKIFGTHAKAHDVVREGLDALQAGRGCKVPGARNFAMVQSGRLAPRRAVASLSEKLNRPLSGAATAAHKA